jgi:hypothetical protein
VLAITGIDVATLVIAAVAALSAIAAAALTVSSTRSAESSRWVRDARKAAYAGFISNVLRLRQEQSRVFSSLAESGIRPANELSKGMTDLANLLVEIEIVGSRLAADRAAYVHTTILDEVEVVIDGPLPTEDEDDARSDLTSAAIADFISAARLDLRTPD